VATGPHRDFQLAGELYGRLRLAFAFGELMMFSSAWGGGRIPTGVSYRWVFNVDGSSYGIEHFVLSWTWLQVCRLRLMRIV